jgi:hypothetical protein
MRRFIAKLTDLNEVESYIDFTSEDNWRFVNSPAYATVIEEDDYDARKRDLKEFLSFNSFYIEYELLEI